MDINLEFILHIGAHRTATTSIQEALDQNLNKLLKKNVICLTPPGIGRRKGKTIRSLLRGFEKSHLVGEFLYKLYYVRSLRKKFHNLISDTAKFKVVKEIIISEENLLGPAFDAKSINFYPQVLRRLKGLKMITKGKVKEIHFCIRSYDTFITSYYAMSALYYCDVFDFESVSRRWLNFSGGWYHAIKSVANFFPDTVIRVYTFEESSPKEIFHNIVSPYNILYSWPKEKINSSPTEGAIKEAISLKLKKVAYDPDQLVIKYKNFKNFEPLNAKEKEQLRLRYKKDLDLIKMEGWL